MEGTTLITGGAGYIGMLVAEELLAASHDVRVLDSLLHDQQGCAETLREQGVDLRVADARDAERARRGARGVDEVVHLAAIVGDPACARDPAKAQAVNVDATRRLLADVRGRRRRAASCSPRPARTMGAWPIRPCRSTSRPRSHRCRSTPSRRSRWSARSSALEHAALSTTCLRFATVYGVAPRMRFDLTVNEFTRDLWADRELEVFGEQFWRPYVHVRDAARAVRDRARRAGRPGRAARSSTSAGRPRTTASSTSCRASASRSQRGAVDLRPPRRGSARLQGRL